MTFWQAPPVVCDDVVDEPMAAVPDEDHNVEEEVVEQRVLRKRKEKTTTTMTATIAAVRVKQEGGKVRNGYICKDLETHLGLKMC